MKIETVGTVEGSDSVTVAVMTDDGNVSTASEWEVEGGPQSAVLRLIAIASSEVGCDRVAAVVYYHNA